MLDLFEDICAIAVVHKKRQSHDELILPFFNVPGAE